MSMLSNSHLVKFKKNYNPNIMCPKQKRTSEAIFYQQNFTISTIPNLLLQYYDAEPPVKPHIYSHTSNVTLLELFYLRIYPLVLINLMPPAKLAPDLRSQGDLRRENTIITSCLWIISASDHFIHPKQTYTTDLSHWYAVSRTYGCTLIPLHQPSWPQI